MAGENFAFPWARTYDADQLAAFIDDLWGAASGDDDLKTLDAIEDVIAKHRPDDDTPTCPLTPRELQIVAQVAGGETYESAARNLGMSTDSLRCRGPQIYARLGARNAAHAAAIVVHHGWVTDLHIPQTRQAPRVLHGPMAWNRRYHDSATALRQRPGSELEIGPYGSRHGARGAARRIRRGTFDPFQPAGAFDAQSFPGDDGRWYVRACYLGDPDESATTHDTAPGAAA